MAARIIKEGTRAAAAVRAHRAGKASGAVANSTPSLRRMSRPGPKRAAPARHKSNRGARGTAAQRRRVANRNAGRREIRQTFRGTGGPTPPPQSRPRNMNRGRGALDNAQFRGMNDQISGAMASNNLGARARAGLRPTVGKAAIGVGMGAGATGGLMYGATRNRGRTSIYGSPNTPGQYY